MQRLIFNVFFSIGGGVKAPNIHKNKIGPYDIYLRNSFVSLYTAKQHSPETDVAIVTNIPLQGEYRELFETNGIKNHIIPFDKFNVPETFKWGYAFYKLCALYHMVKEFEYDTYLELDTDTITVSNLMPMWEDVEYSKRILLYNLHRPISHPVGKVINEDYHKVYDFPLHIDQLGGEYICGRKKELEEFLELLEEIYTEYSAFNFKLLDPGSGDEAFVSMTAARLKKGVLGFANPYINRFWTGSFYLVSTNWKYDPVLIWHLPAEKNYGMLKLYSIFSRCNGNGSKKMTKEEMAKICCLPKTSVRFTFETVKKIISRLIK